MTISVRHIEMQARSLQQVSNTMDPSIAPPSRVMMGTINDATLRSEMELKQAQEAAARITALLEAERAVYVW